MTVTRDEIVSADFRTVLGHFPTGVAIITGEGDDGPAGLTVQSFMALSLDPPLVLLSVARGSTSWPRIAASPGGFAVNVLASTQQTTAMTFARSGGEKFSGVLWHPGEVTGAPILDGAQAWIECRTWRTYDGGDHEIIVASVESLGTIEDPASHPLLFFRSKFPRLDHAHWSAISANRPPREEIILVEEYGSFDVEF